jgi:hypothetical protein
MVAARMSKLEGKLSTIDCPSCHYTLSSLVMRCDASMGGECLMVAHCGHCGEWVDVEQARTVEEEFHLAAESARARGCRTCGTPELSVEFRCDLASRDCFIEATCAAGHSHRL